MIDLTRKVSPTIKAPIVLFTYYNPIYQRGFENFVEEIASAGAKGLLVPDIPLEETAKLSEICTANGLDLVLLSTPTTPVERMERIAGRPTGSSISSPSPASPACAPAWNPRRGARREAQEGDG